MSGNRELKAGAGYMIGNVLIKGVTFITLPIFSRLMSTDDYGLYNTYIAYEGIITIIIGLGLHSSIKNAKYDFSKDLESYVSTQSIITILTTAILISLFIKFQKLIYYITGFSIFIVMMLVLQSFGQAMLNIANARLALEYKYKTYLLYAGFNTIINILLSILLMYTCFNSDRFTGRVIGSALPLTIIGVYIFFNMCSKGKFRCNKKMMKYGLLYGIPLIWHFLAQQVEAQFDRIMITSIKGASYTGIYSFTYSIASIFVILFYSTDNVWNVWFYKQMDSKNYDSIVKKSKEYMLLITVLACIMMFGSREVIMIMGSKPYWEGIDLFIPIIFGMYFLFLYTIPVGIEYFFKKTKYIAATTIVAALFNIVTNYIFIHLYGYEAAAYTTAFSYIIMFVMHWVIAKKILKKNNIESFFHITTFLKYIVITGICGVCVLCINPYPLIKYFVAIILVVLCAIKNKELLRLFIRLVKERMRLIKI